MEASEKLTLRADLIQLELQELTTLLETHREQQAEYKTPAAQSLF